MERHGLDATGAFDVLRRYSEVHNIKLRYVAEHLIAACRPPAPGEITNGMEDTMAAG